MTNRADHAAAHLRVTVAPAVRGAVQAISSLLGMEPPIGRPALDVRAAAHGLDKIAVSLEAAADNLARQRHVASQGRPRTGDSERRGGTATSSTEATALELDRIRSAGMDLSEALDFITPDPRWPAVPQRRQTAAEAVLSASGACHGTLAPENAWGDLCDATETLCDQVQIARRRLSTALAIRAWATVHDDVDPPPLSDLLRCTGWPRRALRLDECEQYAADLQGEDGSGRHADLCLDCLRLLCPACGDRARRTAGASECERCHTRARRMVA